jgi:hypothetical protein
MAMQIRQYGAEGIAQYGSRSRANLQASGGGRHGHWFWCKKLSCGIVKSLFEASVQKAQNVTSTQLIKATSCVEKSNPTVAKSTAPNTNNGQKLLKLPSCNKAC